MEAPTRWQEVAFLAAVLSRSGGVEAGAAAPDSGGYSGGAAERAWPCSGRGSLEGGAAAAAACGGARWLKTWPGCHPAAPEALRSGLNSGRKLARPSDGADDGGALGRRFLS